MMLVRSFMGRGAGICCVGVVELRMRRPTLCSKEPAVVATIAASVIVVQFNISSFAKVLILNLYINHRAFPLNSVEEIFFVK